MRIANIIVIYNQSCSESLTCQTVAQNTVQPDILLVVDNGTQQFSNEEYCNEHGWKYISMCGNAGLSKAYNAALELLRGEADIFVWADDDTSFPPDYFLLLSLYAKGNPGADLFLPVVLSRDRIISPCIAKKYRVMSIEKVQQLVDHDITAINSGLAVRSEIYSSYRYDERLFLDCVDHDFMQWCRQNKKEVCIMERVTLKQTFFSDSRPKRDKALFRQKIFSKDFRRYASKWGNNRVITELQILKRRIHLELTCDRH